MQDLLGYSCEEFVGKTLWDIGALKDIAASKDSFDELQRKGYVRYEDLPVETSDGRYINVEFVSNVYVVDGKKVIQCNIRDITTRKQAEEEARKILLEKNEEIRAMTQQLWQSAKLATMGELSASIAHELNNPLATVSLRVESVLEKTPEDNSSHRELKIIEQEIERMSKLIANLLQFSRRSQQQISTVDICEEIEKTLELVYYHLRKNNIVIQPEFAKEAPRIHADRQQLMQMFLNLFTNASDAMAKGGTLTIRVTAPPESMQVIIEIADTGTGIPPEILPKVAEPFYTTKPEGEGTGLGLAICRRIVQEHNGTFDIVSEGISGRGTIVRISLPVRNERIHQPEKSLTQVNVRSKG
jgi:PAS domain S-box-containing protein